MNWEASGIIVVLGPISGGFWKDFSQGGLDYVRVLASKINISSNEKFECICEEIVVGYVDTKFTLDGIWTKVVVT